MLNLTKIGALVLSSALLASTVVYAEIPDTDFEKAIDKYLTSEKGQEKVGLATQSYFKKLQEKMMKDQEAKLETEREEQFKNPKSIDIGKSPVKGPENAKVTIVEFSDFQCPYCTRGRSTMDEVMKMYPKDVKLVFKNLPLEFHDKALPAAKAALAAHKQGKFWEMHDVLFDKQDKLSDAMFLEEAKNLGLNVEQFKKDMASKEIEDQIKGEVDAARKLGFQGTPGFLVNGVAVKGAYPAAEFKKIIDRWIAQGAEAKK